MNVIGPFRKSSQRRRQGPIGLLLKYGFSDHAAAMLRWLGALWKPTASNIGLEYSVTRPPRHPLPSEALSFRCDDAGLSADYPPTSTTSRPRRCQACDVPEISLQNTTSIQRLSSFLPPYPTTATRYLR